MRPIDVLVPELFAQEGGIQVYSRTLIRALRQLRPHTPLRAFIRNDHPRHLPDSGWEGVEWHPAGGSSWRLAGSLLRAGRRRRPQLLLSTHANYAPLQWFHQRLCDSPSWCTAHGIEVWTLQAGPRRWALARLQHLLPVSQFTGDRLRQRLGSSCPPLSLLPNCVDPRRFHPGPPSRELLARYGLSPHQPVIFTLSRLSRNDAYKNIDRLIEALPPLLQSWPGLRLMIAGDGDDRCRLQLKAQTLGVAECVIFPGRLNDAELADHHRLAALFALPSSGEGFGIVFLEALACGRPVLAGSRDGSSEPLGQGRFGLLVDPELPLAPALASLLAGQGPCLWFQPQKLAEAVVAEFGFAAFCLRLQNLLSAQEIF
jgi:glycosyltransferase involved in cell wall biosynthesis